MCIYLYTDVLYAWQNPEYKVVEDSESLVVNLCLVSESSTLTFPVEVSVTSTVVSAIGMCVIHYTVLHKTSV